VAAKGVEEKKGLHHRGGCCFYSQQRRLAKAVRAASGAVVVVILGVAERWRLRSLWQCRCSDGAVDGSAPEIKMGALACSKNPNFCMLLAWDIMNNFLNCTDIKLPTQKYLNILEQVQYLNL
jgi:hypothetical protein